MQNQTTRRTFLRSAPLAAAAFATPATEAAMAEELPVDRIGRLGRELAVALNDYDKGRWHAVIFPSNHHEFAVSFRVTDCYLPPEAVLQNQIDALKSDLEAHTGTHWNLDQSKETGVVTLVDSYRKTTSRCAGRAES